MSSFVGQEFFDKVYVAAHPDLFFQHRGKGRWYIVPGADATVPPPSQALKKFKAKKKTNPTIKSEDNVPKEPRITRKRAAVIDHEDQPVLKATRTRQGSARDAAIDIDAEAPKNSDETSKGSWGKQAANSDADTNDTGDEIPVASVRLSAKSKAKPKTKASPPKKKKARATPMLNYVPTESVKPADAMSDMMAMGITKEDLAKRGPEPAVDSATQRKTSLLKTQNEELAKKRIVFDKKQAKRAIARKAGVAKNDDTQISIDEDGISTHWVLFDPLRGFPPGLGAAPEIFERLSRYMPGNTRIIAYNIETFNCLLRKTPKFFAKHRVEYHTTGPKLVMMRGESPDKPEVRVDSPLAASIASE